LGWLLVKVFAVDVDGFGNEVRTATATVDVFLLETDQLHLLVEEVDEIDHFRRG
jgi:hypothetical protein